MFTRKIAARWPVFAAAAMAGLLSSCVAPEKPMGKVASVADDGNHPGEGAYEVYCSSCHEDASTDAPSTEAIRQLSRASIKYAVELGYMRELAKDVPADQLQEIINWLPRDPVNAGGWTQTARCPANRRAVQLNRAPRTSTNFGVGDHNNRSMTAAQAGLSKADMKNLEVAWVVAFPQTATMRSQPVIIGDTVFIAATDSGHVYALDTDTGCVKWTYTSDLTLRSSLAFAEATKTSPELIVMGDAAGRIHAIDAKTGRERWVTDVKLNAVNRITGAPVIHNGRVFAPLSAIEVNYTSPDSYECCQGQGAVVALDLATGKKLWVARTMEDAKPTMKDRTGAQKWGPSGAIIWSTPVVDPKRNLLYVGTGENTSWPATDTSDSIIAYDMTTGARKWVFQATKADIWNYACGRRGANCDWPGEYQSPDHDFGATSMLIKRTDGSELVIAGQKSGVLWALDPDTGAMKWSNKIGRGSAGGGMRWGLAFDGERIFAPQNDGAGPAENPNWGPGIHAVNAMTGEIDWSYKPNARDCGANLPAAVATRPPAGQRMLKVVAPVLPPARTPAPARAGAPAAGRPAAPAGEGAQPGVRCRTGMSAAPLLVDDAVVTGTNGGMLRIFDGKSGEVLFEYQTNKPYPETANGVKGQGGSLDSAPYAAGDGTLFVQSGYARFGQPPGNVLMAFRPKTKVAAR